MTRRSARISVALTVVAMFASGTSPVLAAYPAPCEILWQNHHIGEGNVSNAGSPNATGIVATMDPGTHHPCTTGSDTDNGLIIGTYLSAPASGFGDPSGQVGSGYMRMEYYSDSWHGCSANYDPHYYIIVETWQIGDPYDAACIAPSGAPAPTGNDFKARIDEISNGEWYVYFDYDNNGTYDSTTYVWTNGTWVADNLMPQVWMERFDKGTVQGISTNKTNLYAMKYRLLGGSYQSPNSVTCNPYEQPAGNPVEHCSPVNPDRLDIWFS